MKIAFLSRILYLSGVTTHMRDLAKQLIAKGHSVTILTGGVQFHHNSGMDVLYKSLLDAGIEIKYINYPKECVSKFSYGLALFKSSYPTYKFLKSEKFDIIHVHTPVLSFIPKMYFLKFVTTIHLAELQIGLLQQSPSHEIAISNEIYKERIKRKHYSNSNISLIFNGVDESFSERTTEKNKEDIKKKLKLPLDKVIIGFVGTLCYRKGLDILLNASNLLCEKLGDKFHVVFIGNYDNEEDKNWLIKTIDETQSGKYLSIFKYQDPKIFYDIFDIFCLPSRLEGFPLVAIEAMMSGCCVVRSNVEGANDQIISGVDGFLFENQNHVELSNILYTLIINSEKIKEVANAGRKKALEKFTSKVMCKKTLKVYEKVKLKW